MLDTPICTHNKVGVVVVVALGARRSSTENMLPGNFFFQNRDVEIAVAVEVALGNPHHMGMSEKGANGRR